MPPSEPPRPRAAVTLAALLLASAAGLPSGPPVRAAASAAAPPTAAAWAGDARRLLAAVDSLHPDPYRAHDRDAWRRAAEDLERRFPALDPARAAAGLARLLALAGDGHSRPDHVSFPRHGRPRIGAEPWPGFDTRYPFEARVFADGLWLTAAAAPHAGLAGGRIAAVNGVPTAAAADSLRRFVSADSPWWFLYLLPEALASPGYVYAAGLVPGPDAPLRLTLEEAGGARRVVELAPVPRAAAPDGGAPTAPAAARRPPAVRDRVPGDYGFVDLAGGPRTVYARIRQVRDAGAGESFAEFSSRLVAHADSVGAERLVLDLRGNAGGDNYLNQPLVHALIASARLNRPGRLMVLVDRGTFSAAVSLAADLERNTRALFVGEPTGAGPNACGDPARVTLPGSGMVVKISTLLWQHSDPRDARRSIAPDVPVFETAADHFAGRDPALEAALDLRTGDAPPMPRPNENWARPSQRAPREPEVRW